MSDNTPDAPNEPAPIEPTPALDPTPAPAAYVPQPSPQPDVLADVHHPVGSSYDPMPLEVSDAKSRNWMGIVALVFGIIGGSIIAIVFGILGLSAAKKGKATNRGMSIWGIVLGVIWLVLSIIATIAFVAFVVNAANQTAAAGDCYVSTATSDEDFLDASPVVISCSIPTNSEVYYVTTFDGASVPGDETFLEDVYFACISDTALANVDQEVASEYYVEYYVPNASSWDTDPHTVICGLANDAGVIDEGAILND